MRNRRIVLGFAQRLTRSRCSLKRLFKDDTRHNLKPLKGLNALKTLNWLLFNDLHIRNCLDAIQSLKAQFIYWPWPVNDWKLKEKKYIYLLRLCTRCLTFKECCRLLFTLHKLLIRDWVSWNCFYPTLDQWQGREMTRRFTGSNREHREWHRKICNNMNDIISFLTSNFHKLRFKKD